MRKASTRLPEQGTQTPSPAPDLILAETENQPRTHTTIGAANGGTSDSRFMSWPIALQVALPLRYLLESIRIELHGLLSFKRVARNLLIGS